MSMVFVQPQLPKVPRSLFWFAWTLVLLLGLGQWHLQPSSQTQQGWQQNIGAEHLALPRLSLQTLASDKPLMPLPSSADEGDPVVLAVNNHRLCFTKASPLSVAVDHSHFCWHQHYRLPPAQASPLAIPA
ncbi:hypothetical protein P2G88_11435 [Aliiglaciecola sp. CAU 1673]|uniref:hypothetical protein n=1 Tax=Aliiglaciecola sp. CAU 1673 TaxID=3032595 RepID=UPI0023DB7B0F|nr:hypothetical protein [Aliiglaciecola sp. CAU 1673]MDF2178861.1 hypothetical protein [Aliiglaciecola sp. CAU 1673]